MPLRIRETNSTDYICSLSDGKKAADNKMMKNFNKFGVMLDCSRNAVMTVEQLKKFITILSRMGYNQVQLYMEDTYEINEEVFFGYLRGKYTQEELKELDDFAYASGVELVPNIQTLAHMSAFLKLRPDLRDIDDIMLIGDERVYDLIDRMFQSLRQCFRTQNLHIGMDEAHNLGRGKFYDINGPKNRFDILLNHLNRVSEIADKYNFKPMIWSDMFYRLANNGNYYAASSTFDSSIKERIPKNTTLVYWDYYSLDKNNYDGMIEGHQQLSNQVIFAGGAWKWSGFAPHNYFSIKANHIALQSCIEHEITDVFLTMWGDNGAECSAYAVLPTLCHSACMAQGITKMADIKDRFYEWIGVKYDDFMLFDTPNLLEKTNCIVTPSKYFFYADCFMSKFLNLEKPEYCQKYAAISRKLKSAGKRAGEYAYLFDTMSKLTAVLSIKGTICSRTREAYTNGDIDKLNTVIADYKKMIKLTEAFYKSFRTQWYIENKPHGFDIQDVRIGGLIGRMKSCLDRLCAFRDGKITSIPELEETIVPYSDHIFEFNSWESSFTCNVI